MIGKPRSRSAPVASAAHALDPAAHRQNASAAHRVRPSPPLAARLPMAHLKANRRAHDNTAMQDNAHPPFLPGYSCMSAQTTAAQTVVFGTPLSAAAVRVMLLGAGELGKEVLIALQRLGVETIAVDRYADAPGQQVAHHARTIA